MTSRLPRALRATVLLGLLATASGCGTIAGTAVSPITGGVDLAKMYVTADNWWMAPVYFTGGAIAGPFVAFYNGVIYDASVFSSFSTYWFGFAAMFRPFQAIQ